MAKEIKISSIAAIHAIRMGHLAWNDTTWIIRYICWLGGSVLRKNGARTQDQGHSFSQYGPTKAGKLFNLFSYFVW